MGQQYLRCKAQSERGQNAQETQGRVTYYYTYHRTGAFLRRTVAVVTPVTAETHSGSTRSPDCINSVMPTVRHLGLSRFNIHALMRFVRVVLHQARIGSFPKRCGGCSLET